VQMHGFVSPFFVSAAGWPAKTLRLTRGSQGFLGEGSCSCCFHFPRAGRLADYFNRPLGAARWLGQATSHNIDGDRPSHVGSLIILQSATMFETGLASGR
jgi:hypothetical protein